MSLFTKPKCPHVEVLTSFKNLHTGADGEIYVVFKEVCRRCDWNRINDVRLPESVTNVIHENMHVGTLALKKTDATESIQLRKKTNKMETYLRTIKNMVKHV